jgi:hypothetical protein
MKKSIVLAAALIGFTGFLFARQSKDTSAENAPSDRGFFVFAGLLYDYKKIKPDPQFESSGLSGLLGLGYDFDRITVNLKCDYMMLSLIRYTGLGHGTPSIKDSFNGGIGVDIGVKVVNGDIFDLTIPAGVSARFSGYTVEHGNEREFKYTCIAIESGLMLSLRLTGDLVAFVPFYIGVPVYKKSTVTGYTQTDFDVFGFSMGLGIRQTFGKR